MTFFYRVKKKKVSPYMLYIKYGLAGMMGTGIMHPLDLVKARMQLSRGEYKNSLDCMTRVFKTEGFVALYKGVSASLLRQATYNTARVGFFYIQLDKYREAFNAEPSEWDTMGMGLVAGAIATLVGTPADLALIRMMTDNHMPPEYRRNYKNVADALKRIVKEEGVLQLWRGCISTLCHVLTINLLQLATYVRLREAFAPHVPEGLPLHFCTVACCSLLTVTTGMPLDTATTRIQYQVNSEYSGAIDALTQMARNEGVSSLWKGFTPCLCRLIPVSIIFIYMVEQLTKAQRELLLGDD